MPRPVASRSNRTAKTKRPLQTWLTPGFKRNAVVAVLAAITFGFVILLVAWMRICAGNACPSVDGLTGYSANQAAKVYAADGRLITDLGLERRTVVPLKEMAPAVIAAFVTTEDKRFYSHHGIDWFRVFGAIKNNLIEGRVAEGFSTITMQLARNLWPEDISGRDKSIRRKMREARVALEIERKLPKDRILELYLNQIDLGNRAYGVEVASQRYFGKSVRDLNVAEAATLAAIPKAPSRYNPKKNPNLSVQRRNVVINLLRDAGKLSPADAERWKAYPLLLSSRSDFSGVAEYFVEYVRQQMYSRFGDDLYKQGYSIYTTLDLDMQQAAERALEDQLRKIEKIPGFRHETYKAYTDAHAADDSGNHPQTPYLQGLVLTLDAHTGAIRVMIGGRDFGDSKFNRTVQALRQPGSTFKPFVYSAAIRAGYPLSHIVVDEPFTLDVPGQDTWTPQNYDLQFKGPHDLRWNLKESRNIPAIKLGMEIGEDAVIAEARRFGISTPITAVPAINIGAADVLPIEMISAYTAFATLGTRVEPSAILRVEDRKGNIVWQPTPRSEEVMTPQHAWLMTSVLRDVVLHGTAAGTVGGQVNFPTAGKTGTTNDGNDVWFIGFTPELVTGVWMGFDQPTKIISNAQGGRLAAPAWTTMMKEIYDRRPIPREWSRPDGLTLAEVDITSGYKATTLCPTDVRYMESFIPGTEPTEFCPLHLFDPFGGSTVGGAAAPGGTATPAAAPAAAPPH